MIPGGLFLTFLGGKLPELLKQGQFYIAQWFQWVFWALLRGKAPQVDQIFKNLDVFSRRCFSTFFLDVSSRRFLTFLVVFFSTFLDVPRRFLDIFGRSPRFPFFWYCFALVLFFALFLSFCSIFVFCTQIQHVLFVCVFSTYFHEKIVWFFFFGGGRCHLYFIFVHADALNFSHCTRATQENNSIHSISAIAPENVRKNDSNSARNWLQMKLEQSTQANSDKIGLRSNVMFVKNINIKEDPKMSNPKFQDQWNTKQTPRTKENKAENDKWTRSNRKFKKKTGKLEFQPKQLKQTQPEKFKRQATKDSRKIIGT